MQIRDAICCVHSLHSKINPGSIFELLGKDFFSIWETCEENAIIFCSKLDQEKRQKFWNWTCIDNISTLKNSYNILFFIFRKFENDGPHPLKEMWMKKRTNFNLFVSRLSQELLEILITWAENNLSLEEIEKLQSSEILSLQDLKIEDKKRVIKSDLNNFSGISNRTFSKIRNTPVENKPILSPRGRPQNIAGFKNANTKNTVQQPQQKPSIRTLEDLKRIFGEN